MARFDFFLSSRCRTYVGFWRDLQAQSVGSLLTCVRWSHLRFCYGFMQKDFKLWSMMCLEFWLHGILHIHTSELAWQRLNRCSLQNHCTDTMYSWCCRDFASIQLAACCACGTSFDFVPCLVMMASGKANLRPNFLCGRFATRCITSRNRNLPPSARTSSLDFSSTFCFGDHQKEHVSFQFLAYVTDQIRSNTQPIDFMIQILFPSLCMFQRLQGEPSPCFMFEAAMLGRPVMTRMAALIRLVTIGCLHRCPQLDLGRHGSMTSQSSQLQLASS